MWEVVPWERYVWLYPDIAFDEHTKRMYVSNGWKKEILVFDTFGTAINETPKPLIDNMNNPSALCFIKNKKERYLLALNTGGTGVTRFAVEESK